MTYLSLFGWHNCSGRASQVIVYQSKMYHAVLYCKVPLLGTTTLVSHSLSCPVCISVPPTTRVCATLDLWFSAKCFQMLKYSVGMKSPYCKKCCEACSHHNSFLWEFWDSEPTCSGRSSHSWAQSLQRTIVLIWSAGFSWRIFQSDTEWTRVQDSKQDTKDRSEAIYEAMWQKRE